MSFALLLAVKELPFCPFSVQLLALGSGHWLSGFAFVIPLINTKIPTKIRHSIFISFQLEKQTRNYT